MILLKNILQEGDPVLRKKAAEVKIPLTKKDQKTIEDMMEYLENSQDEILCEKYGLRGGVGLAAPQIGVSKRIFCMLTFDEKNKNFYKYAFINPLIVANSIEKTYLPGGEGCLSVEESKNNTVLRYSKIKIKAMSYNFKTKIVEPVSLTLTGYPSIVFQHEYDHLNGILFVDKITTDVFKYEPLKFTD